MQAFRSFCPTSVKPLFLSDTAMVSSFEHSFDRRRLSLPTLQTSGKCKGVTTVPLSQKLLENLASAINSGIYLKYGNLQQLQESAGKTAFSFENDSESLEKALTSSGVSPALAASALAFFHLDGFSSSTCKTFFGTQPGSPQSPPTRADGLYKVCLSLQVLATDVT